MSHSYNTHLEKNSANFTPLTPLSFLDKAAYVYPDRVAVVHGTERYTWKQEYVRCRKLASALHKLGIGEGDTVAAMLPNIPALVDLHFAPAMLGAVLNALNTRLDAEAIAFMLEHSEAKVLFCDLEYSETVQKALSLVKKKPVVIDVVDPMFTGQGKRLGGQDYATFLSEGDADFRFAYPSDEWNAISLNYTSGTTGNPKGVVCHHRGAYMNAVGNVLTWGMQRHPVYLWTLPMFHCNGWCFPWTIAAQAGTNVCLRKVEAKTIFDLMRVEKVSHYCGAPIVHSTLINAPEEMKMGIDHPISAMVAGAAPPAAMIEGMERLGFSLVHTYGLTEIYGPASVCAPHREWQNLSLEARAEKNSRQGVAYLLQEDMVVMDPETMKPVPWDGETMGEIMFRGNITMKGYLKNRKATDDAFKGGWFHTGDLAVTYPDGYSKIKDRSKDIIISGGENISSLDVEDVLYRHPAIIGAAVVAKPDEKWGETPCAFVELREGATATQEEIIAFCRERLAGFKCPKTIVFGSVPKTSTGKIQKFQLRERAKSL